MSFLSVWSIAIAAGLTVPPLVLLYFLKLRRQEKPVSSTIFWKRAIEDLQVNAPFQKLRRNLLLFLQLLVLLLCAVALGRPLWQQSENLNKSLILLVDRSASMNVREPDGRTRLERAKDEALKAVARMNDEGYDRGLLIAFNDRASVICPFTRSQPQLERAIDSITSSEGLSRLQEAMALAQAHAQSELMGRDAPPNSPISTAPAAKIVLFSDGQIEDVASVSSDKMQMELINVAVNNDNVGVVSLSASRYYERPEILNVVAGVQNFGPDPVELDVELFVEGQHKDIKSIKLGPGVAPANAENFNAEDSLQIVSFDEVEFAGSGIIDVQIGRLDGLSVDNRAWAIIEPPRSVTALLVSPGNLWLDRAMHAMDWVEFEKISPEEYEQQQDDLNPAGRSRHDVVIFDGWRPGTLPLGNFLFFGVVPNLPGFGQGPTIEDDDVFNWDDTHPVMRFIEPQNIAIAQYQQLQLPIHAVSLMDGQGGTVVAAVNEQGRRMILVAFGLFDAERKYINTDWPMREHFVYFLSNAVQYLSGSVEAEVEARLRPGDPLVVSAQPNTDSIDISRPDQVTDQLTVGKLSTAHYGKTDRVGIYQAIPTAEGSTLYAVNLFSPTESRIQPAANFAIGGAAVESRDVVLPVTRPLWSWLLVAVLAVLFLEWAVYSRRILV
ncbi:MAG: hypothetical protein HJJLKODD_01539 [Phycisphaerae bacterium]|nr:hypothetical protein [Phycisphaerae bacterium]